MREEGAKPEKLSAPKPQSGGCAQCLQGTQSQGLHGFLSAVLGTARDDPTDAESGTAPATRRHGGTEGGRSEARGGVGRRVQLQQGRERRHTWGPLVAGKRGASGDGTCGLSGILDSDFEDK